jgi:hypothetical protein
VDNLEEGNVFIFIRSCTEEDLPKECHPPVTPGAVRIDNFFAGYSFLSIRIGCDC